MSAKFGTSGLRGLVSELTEDVIARHVRAFIAVCETGSALYVGQDLRASSPRITADVRAAARKAGCRVIDCGALPTPALALEAHRTGGSAIMVTGSHIPADRNGLKFYSRTGEITKAEEQAILAQLDEVPRKSAAPGTCSAETGAATRFVTRYLEAFGQQVLSGRRIGLYAHSAVGRDMLGQILSGLGAHIVELDRLETFIPLDTEAIDPDTRIRIRTWVTEHALDALVSTDGDSDRPLLADETGQIVPGDILGQITAESLRAETVVTPITSNSGITRKGFATLQQTRVGSPYVIAGMQQAAGRVVGYEANGGFLLGFDAQGPCGPLPALVTRDSVLPLLATLVAAQGGTLSARVAREPDIVTQSARLQDVPLAHSQTLVSALAENTSTRMAFLSALDVTERALDLTDGVRMCLTEDRILHIRPSGNAPELRLYVEARTLESAAVLLEKAMRSLQRQLGLAPSA